MLSSSRMLSYSLVVCTEGRRCIVKLGSDCVDGSVLCQAGVPVAVSCPAWLGCLTASPQLHPRFCPDRIHEKNKFPLILVVTILLAMRKMQNLCSDVA